ncbi:hypothetical protein [Neptunomonas sp.]|uniref:phage tail terminator protein n=1 Tax=Neptunomonas sp. TaxID=1971898 RepID=UPI0025DBC64D|nr:hypothetical protein [Neptunomonas sp.]
MLDLQEDYLAAEGHLVEKLGSIEGIRKVYCSCDLAEMKEEAQNTPALHVIYNGDTVTNNAQGGALSHPKQTWVIVLAVNLRKKGEAGVLLAKVLKHMAGAHGPLGSFKRVNAGRPSFTRGFGYYPMAYEITFRVKR